MDSYKRIASECQLPGGDDTTADVIQVVRDWLDTKCPFEWFMVVDNLDDRAGFLEGSEHSETEKALCEYVPQSARGTILYTTRSRDIGIDLSPKRDPIMVQCLNFDEAQALLGESLVSRTSEDDQLALFKSLAYFPLAISQATAFMIKRRKRVADYLNLLQDNSTRSQILSQRGYHHDRAERSSESIVSTWWVTFRLIQRENARAAELLAMMSLLDRHEIPLFALQDPDEGAFEFEEATGLLEAFSLITTFSGENRGHGQALQILNQLSHKDRVQFGVFGEMHRLVQESTKAWLNRHDGNAARIIMKNVQNIGRYCRSQFIYSPVYHLMYPHVNASLCYGSEMLGAFKEHFQENPDSVLCTVELLQNTSTYLELQQRMGQSERNALLAMNICKTYLGDRNETTLRSMGLYARIMFSCGRQEEAHNIQCQVLHISEEAFGNRHSLTISTGGQLGWMLTMFGNLADAQELLWRKLVDVDQRFSENPGNDLSKRDLIYSLAWLADVYMGQDDIQYALQLLDEALDLAAASHQAYRYLRWMVMVLLARCYRQCGDYQEARSLLEPALDCYRDFYGHNHPLTLRYCRELVDLLRAEGRWDEAEDLLKSLIDARFAINDSDYDACIDMLRYMGDIQYSRGKFEKAENTFRRSLQMLMDGKQKTLSRQTIREDHFRNMIRQCLEFQGKCQESRTDMIPSGPTALRVFESLGRESRKIFAKPRLEESTASSTTKVAIHAKVSNQYDRPALLKFMHELGQNQVLPRSMHRNGWNHDKTKQIIINLTVTSEELGRLDESEKYWNQLLCWQNRISIPDYTTVFRAHNAIALLMARRGNFEDAEKAWKSAFAIPPAHFKKLDPRIIIRAFFIFGVTLYNEGILEKGRVALSQGYTDCVDLLGSCHLASLSCLIMLTRAEESADNSDRVEELYYLLGTTLALPSYSEEEDFDESASESDHDSVTMALHSEEESDERASESDHDRATMALPSDGGKEDFDDSASKSDHDSDSSSWETTDSDSSHDGRAE